jgi:hypothetical protein
MKITRKVDIRVEVEPDIYPLYGVLRPWKAEEVELRMMTEATRLLEQIRRHVDDSRFAVIRFNVEHVCSFCGDASEWGDEVPECCQESIDEYEAAK